MKLAMRLTLDGLIRTLRMQAQQLADDVEFPDQPSDMDDEATVRGRQRRRTMTGADDDAIRR